MYTYYALSSLGPRFQPYLFWKKRLTEIQLLQFLIIAVYGSFLLIMHQDYPIVARWMPLSQAFIYLFLFGDFYFQSYKVRTSAKQE